VHRLTKKQARRPPCASKCSTLGLLRAADPPRRPAGREGRRQGRPQGVDAARERDPRGREVTRAMTKDVQAELEDLASWLELGAIEPA
jgi:hypothetical protein